MYDCAIVMPVFNACRTDQYAEFFKQAVQSAMDAIHSCDCKARLVISDDGSTDETLKAIAYLAKDKDVRIIGREVNRGVAYALNEGITVSAAHYIMPMGSDDIINRLALDEYFQYLEEHAEIPMAGCFHNYIDVDGKELKVLDDLPTDPRDVRLWVLAGNCRIGFPMYSRNLWQQLGRYNEDQFCRCCEDWDFFLRVAELYPIGMIDKVLYSYRDAPEGLTKGKYMPLYFAALDQSRTRRRKCGNRITGSQSLRPATA